MMFVVHVRRRNRRTMLGSYATHEEAQQAALTYWCKETGWSKPDEIKGTWLESYDHEQGTRLWFFVPELPTLEALNWTMPSCEIRSAA